MYFEDTTNTAFNLDSIMALSDESWTRAEEGSPSGWLKNFCRRFCCRLFILALSKGASGVRN
jgi:hypothetical protein